MRARTLLLVLCLIGVVFLGSAEGAASARLLVGYEPGDADAAHLAIVAAGGRVQRASSELGIAIVHSDDTERFRQLATLSPHIQYVERDDPTRLAGAQWNGAQWNGAQWNGAQWNGAQWNGAQWNGAQWNGAQWNGAQSDAARWTVKHFAAEHPAGWSYGDSSDPGLSWQWGTWAIRAVHAWETSMGAGGATLCVLDSGVASTHPDIAPNFAGSWNAIEPGASAEDDAGHGTHIAGLAAAATGNGYGVAGVANERILSVKVLDADGHGLEGDLAFGIAWCAAQGADVAVMALSASEPGPSMDRALAFAAQRDVLLLASAGNTAGAVEYPANDPRVVAVGAVDGDLALASFSSRGAEIELTAPGVAVLGPMLGDAFAFGSGTSQAVGIAAGVAALVRDADPTLTAAEARALLHSTARDLGEAGNDPAYGHGLVDADAAVAAALR